MYYLWDLLDKIMNLHIDNHENFIDKIMNLHVGNHDKMFDKIKILQTVHGTVIHF